MSAHLGPRCPPFILYANSRCIRLISFGKTAAPSPKRIAYSWTNSCLLAALNHTETPREVTWKVQKGSYLQQQITMTTHPLRSQVMLATDSPNTHLSNKCSLRARRRNALFSLTCFSCHMRFVMLTIFEQAFYSSSGSTTTTITSKSIDNEQGESH